MAEIKSHPMAELFGNDRNANRAELILVMMDGMKKIISYGLETAKKWDCEFDQEFVFEVGVEGDIYTVSVQKGRMDNG